MTREDEYFTSAEIRHSGVAFKDESSFQSHILHERSRITQSFRSQPLALIYSNIPELWAENVLYSNVIRKPLLFKSYDPYTLTLKLAMAPTSLHNADQEWYRRCERDWLQANDVTAAELGQITAKYNDESQFPSGPYVGKRKAANISLQLAGSKMPRIVFESRYSERWDELHDDMNDWIVGGDGAVRMVVLVKWSKPRNSTAVSGDVEVYVPGRDGTPMRTQIEQVFPEPQSAHNQVIELTRRMVFGNQIARPNDTLKLDFAHLRAAAQAAMTSMDLTPA